MHTDIRPQYGVVFTSEEYRLVTLSLAGKLSSQEDIDAARQLNVHMTHQRVNHLKSLCKQAEVAMEQALVVLKQETKTNEQTNE